jgi:hypothetical protein
VSTEGLLNCRLVIINCISIIVTDSEIKYVLNLFQSAHPYKYAGEKVDVQGLDVFKVTQKFVFWLSLNFVRFC